MITYMLHILYEINYITKRLWELPLVNRTNVNKNITKEYPTKDVNQNSTTNFFPTTQTTATIIGRTNDSNILLGISYLVILLVYIYGGLKVTF